MATSLHNLSEYDLNSVPDASNMNFGIVVSEWNPEITGALLDGAVKTLEKHGTLPENIHVKTVPGSYELIYGAHQMTLNGGYDAIIVLGCVIRGDTPHFDYICEGVTNGIARLNAPGASWSEYTGMFRTDSCVPSGASMRRYRPGPRARMCSTLSFFQPTASRQSPAASRACSFVKVLVLCICIRSRA